MHRSPKKVQLSVNTKIVLLSVNVQHLSQSVSAVMLLCCCKTRAFTVSEHTTTATAEIHNHQTEKNACCLSGLSVVIVDILSSGAVITELCDDPLFLVHIRYGVFSRY